MRTSIILSALLGAGVFGHPHLKLNNPLGHVHHKRQAPAEVHTIIGGNVVDIEDVFVKTVYANGGAPQASPAPVVNYHPQEQQAAAPVVTTTTAPAPKTTPVQVKADYVVPSPQETNTPAPQPSSTPTPSPSSSNDGAPLSNGKSILESANEFRAKQGLNPFTYSSTLGGNAAKTNTDDGANKMTHELNPGSYAQCIAEVDNKTGGGGYTAFELTYLGWLCEIPDSRLGDGCAVMEQQIRMQVDTSDPGHANILRTASYTQMGCNYMDATEPNGGVFLGMYTCDFA
ncbi:hypothetical protein ABVK25_002063 [Lepraria finkii]|uniref:SCP domain-containing protein n=1 Tax=Lepraria finkii TaxID=1340010 RepID=A0ABR4BLM5_9LECA